MKKYDDYTCPKYGVVIDTEKRDSKRIRCEVCGAWCKHLVLHLKKVHNLDIEPNMPPRAANELALKKSRENAPAGKNNRYSSAAKAFRSNKTGKVPQKPQERHSEVRYVHCPVCDDMFISDKERNLHIIKKHLQHHEGGKVECPLCRNIMDSGDGYREVVYHIAICKGRNIVHKRR